MATEMPITAGATAVSVLTRRGTGDRNLPVMVMERAPVGYPERHSLTVEKELVERVLSDCNLVVRPVVLMACEEVVFRTVNIYLMGL